MESIQHLVTLIGVLAIFLYSLTKILNFFDIGESIYGPYILFLIIIIISSIVLPHQYPS